MQGRVIGLIGGMSWESSALYYRLLNQRMLDRLGGHHNARSVLYTLDYDELDRLASAGRWDEVARIVATAGRHLQAAGADFVLITAVTGHAVADAVAASLGVPLLHIADPVGEAVRSAGYRRVGLLGTRFTMQMDFFTGPLRTRHGLEILVPPEPDRLALHRIIIEELTLGRVTQEAVQAVKGYAAALAGQGAEAVIVGCTELPLLMPMADYPLPAFDTVGLHVDAAIRQALA